MTTDKGQAFDVSYRWARLMPFPRDAPRTIVEYKDTSSSLWIPLALGLGTLGLVSLYTIVKGPESELTAEDKVESTQDEQQTGQTQDERHSTNEVERDHDEDRNSESSRDSPPPPPDASSSSTAYSHSEHWTHRRLPTTYESDPETGIHRKTESRQVQVVEESVRRHREYRREQSPKKDT